MLNNPKPSLKRILSAVFCIFVYSASTTIANAWGPDGHSTIGILAIGQLQPDARGELESIVSPLDAQAMVKACNWPDAMRETEEWAWSAPQHYVNIPRGDFVYLQSRDCPNQQCVTEAIKTYAAELGNREASREKRWQAFAWLCHFVGDLHQPLHAGFADDRGGNDFEVVFKNKQMNLHTVWDFELIDQNAGSRQKLVGLLERCPLVKAGSEWSTEMVDDWTNESHQLTRQSVYPARSNIDERYAQQSWELVQKRITTAASRLALIINSELQESSQASPDK